jgi:hypothetical protein
LLLVVGCAALGLPLPFDLLLYLLDRLHLRLRHEQFLNERRRFHGCSSSGAKCRSIGRLRRCDGKQQPQLIAAVENRDFYDIRVPQSLNDQPSNSAATK